MSDCLLPPWPEASLRDAPSLFGTPQDGAWVTDPVGDVVAGELDIQAIGVAPLTIGAVDHPERGRSACRGRAEEGGQARASGTGAHRARPAA